MLWPTWATKVGVPFTTVVPTSSITAVGFTLVTVAFAVLQLPTVSSSAAPSPNLIVAVSGSSQPGSVTCR